MGFLGASVSLSRLLLYTHTYIPGLERSLRPTSFTGVFFLLSPKPSIHTYTYIYIHIYAHIHIYNIYVYSLVLCFLFFVFFISLMGQICHILYKYVHLYVTNMCIHIHTHIHIYNIYIYIYIYMPSFARSS